MTAGIVPDSRMGLNSRAGEWVERREWILECRLPELPPDLPVVLVAEGLDDHGEVWLNGRRVDGFQGMFLTHRFDLSEFVRGDGSDTLRIVFLPPPEVDGQYGYTSRIARIRSRFGYVWDWCPRVLAIGVWQPIRLELGHLRAEGVLIRPVVENGKPVVSIRARMSGAAVSVRAANHAVISLECEGRTSTVAVSLGPRNRTIAATLALPDECDVGRWSIADPVLTRVRISLSLDDERVELFDGRLGFRSIALERLPSAPPASEPYELRLNGERVPIRGVNWVPLSPHTGTVSPLRYRQALERLRDAGVNLLRVWGGAICEREDFYELCDELGLLVWQEFPLSSSGLDNKPNDDPSYLRDLEEVAAEYIRRAAKHPSHVVWCGGNELMRNDYAPVDRGEPAIATLETVCRQLDPGKPFLPASPSGPSFVTRTDRLGGGFHHDVHGPWLLQLESWRTIATDDSLLRSEFGCPAPARMAALEAWRDELPLWPPDNSNPFWCHRGSWWLPAPALEPLCGRWREDELSHMVAVMRALQAMLLGHAAAITRLRGPESAGLIVWMGNEPFPNAANTSVLEYDLSPKPAWHALQRAWASWTLALRHEGPALVPGADRLELIVLGDATGAGLRLELTIRDAHGHERTRVAGTGRLVVDSLANALVEAPHPTGSTSGSRAGVAIVDGVKGEVIHIEATAQCADGAVAARGEWVVCLWHADHTVAAVPQTPLAPLRMLPRARVALEQTKSRGCVVIRNVSSVPALLVTVTDNSVEHPVVLSEGFCSLAVGEARVLRTIDGSAVPELERLSVEALSPIEVAR